MGVIQRIAGVGVVERGVAGSRCGVAERVWLRGVWLREVSLSAVVVFSSFRLPTTLMIKNRFRWKFVHKHS